MKQRIAVRAIVKKDDKVLLLRRATGRESLLGLYELPGGALEYGEQPEDALARHLSGDIGATTQAVQLADALTYIDRDDRDVQYVFIVYIVSLASASSKVQLSQNYDQYAWKKVSNTQQDDLSDSTKLLLGISQHYVTMTSPEVNDQDIVKNTTNLSHLIIYSDGGSRGNPGPSAAGFIIMDSYEHVLHEGGVYLGITTNNLAEYHGVQLGLEKALELGAKTVECRIDSLLVVNQMNGIYQIKNRELWPTHERIRGLVAEFEKVTFSHVRREFNQLADGMVNKILNAHTQE